MHAYILRRLLLGLLIIWGVYTITFFAVNLAPGDPFTAKENAKITEADLDRLRRNWGYDRSIVERYFLHTRKMFWADPETLEYEGGGLGFTIRGTDDGGASVLAWAQEPPAEIKLTPTLESRQDDGAAEITLQRGADGTYPPTPIKQGQYRFGYVKLSARQVPLDVESKGVVISYADGMIRVKDRLAAAPDEVRLNPGEGAKEAVLLKKNGDGTYGPAPIGVGRFETEDGAADVLVPADALTTGGLTFDLGTSIQHNKPVTDYLKPKLWATMKLGFWALLMNYLVGISLGVISAVRRNTKLDHGIMVNAFFLYSMPGFWLALMLQLIFAVHLGWLPIHGMGDGSFMSSLQHYAMPVFVLGVAGAAGTARYQRSAVLEVLGEDYIRTARAKGVDERSVIWKHVMRNSLLPVITLFGLGMPFLVSGAVITEQIFSWPGIGRAAIAAITARDVFVVTAVTLLATVMVVLGNLIADILYAVADPRVRLR